MNEWMNERMNASITSMTLIANTYEYGRVSVCEWQADLRSPN